VTLCRHLHLQQVAQPQGQDGKMFAMQFDTSRC
jgi:hypothetical protein